MPSTSRRANPSSLRRSLTIIALWFVFGIVFYRCPGPNQNSNLPINPYSQAHGPIVHWASWNVHLPPRIAQHDFLVTTNAIHDSLLKLVVDNGIDTTMIHPFITNYFCPCDSTLLNIDLSFINESGNPVTPSSPTNPPPAKGLGMGGSIIPSYNTRTIIPEDTVKPLYIIPQSDKYRPRVDQAIFSKGGNHVVSDDILAILDTGLDTTEFKFGSLIWKDTSGKPTLYNFLPGADAGNFMDDERGFKHGTSVTYIALRAAVNNNISTNLHARLPHVMVLKVLDSTGTGSIFTISCAMSYATQHHATVINASLGYAGPSDTILQQYFQQANDQHIPVIVAAGNELRTPHKAGLVCTSSVNTTDSIGSATPFYPASFSKTMPYVVAVTGVEDTIPCYYQKFSDTFVNVGVNIRTFGMGSRDPIPGTCCSFYIPFLLSGVFVEGSSFSAPILAGTYLYTLPLMIRPLGTQPVGPDPATWLNKWSKTDQPSLKKYVRDGKYFIYNVQ